MMNQDVSLAGPGVGPSVKLPNFSTCLSEITFNYYLDNIFT